MSQRQLDIANMQCWIFHMAQSKWKLTPKECAELFKKHDIWGFISECQELLHVSSYACALDDVEDILRANGEHVAIFSDSASDQIKNTCAINLMRNMLVKYVQKHNTSFENTMIQFAESNTYEMLFDFDTAVWKEGPDYLLDLYEEELSAEVSPAVQKKNLKSLVFTPRLFFVGKYYAGSR